MNQFPLSTPEHVASRFSSQSGRSSQPFRWIASLLDPACTRQQLEQSAGPLALQ